MTFNCGLKKSNKNEWMEVDDYLIVKLTQGQEMMIDKQDRFLIENFVWSAFKHHNIWYSATNIDDKMIRVHRMIMAPENGLVIDHIDRNGLNNRRSNLRVTTVSINARNTKLSKCNTSGYKGIHFCKKDNNWLAYIRNENIRESKSFSIGKYGDAAKEMAIQWCLEKERLYGYLNTH